jgi:hypothetical protein
VMEFNCSTELVLAIHGRIATPRPSVIGVEGASATAG